MASLTKLQTTENILCYFCIVDAVQCPTLITSVIIQSNESDLEFAHSSDKDVCSSCNSKPQSDIYINGSENVGGNGSRRCSDVNEKVLLSTAYQREKKSNTPDTLKEQECVLFASNVKFYLFLILS